MDPIDFPEKNRVYTKPEGWTDEQCSDLPVWVGEVPQHGGSTTSAIISCWKPTAEDIQRIQNGEPVYLMICANAQPPASVFTGNPFS
jgi:hypothetical protein